MVIVLSAQPAWADDAVARITGAAQGLILGDQAFVKDIPALNAIQVFSTGFGISVPEGTVKAAPFTFVKRFDRASPKLLLAAFTGEPLEVDIIWFMRLGTVNKQTMTIKLSGALVTDISAAADLDGTSASGVERVTLSYSKITFTVPNIDGLGQTAGPPITVCLDIASAKTC